MAKVLSNKRVDAVKQRTQNLTHPSLSRSSLIKSSSCRCNTALSRRFRCFCSLASRCATRRTETCRARPDCRNPAPGGRTQQLSWPSTAATDTATASRFQVLIWHGGEKDKEEATCCVAEARSAKPRPPLWRPWPVAGHRSRPASEDKKVEHLTSFLASSLEPLPCLLLQHAPRRPLFSPVRLSDSGIPSHDEVHGPSLASSQCEAQLPGSAPLTLVALVDKHYDQRLKQTRCTAGLPVEPLLRFTSPTTATAATALQNPFDPIDPMSHNSGGD